MGTSGSCIDVNTTASSSSSAGSRDSEDPVEALCRSIFTRDFRKCWKLSKRRDWHELTRNPVTFASRGQRSGNAGHRGLLLYRSLAGSGESNSQCEHPGCLSHRGPNNNLGLMDLPLHVLLTVSHYGKNDKKFYKIIKRLLKGG